MIENENKPLSAYCYQENGRYNIMSNEKQWCVVVRANNGKAVSAIFDESQEIEGMPPSEVISMIKDRINGYLFMSDRDSKLATIAWFEENAEHIDSGWAKAAIECYRKKIDDLDRYVIKD